MSIDVEAPNTPEEKIHQLAIADDIANAAENDVRLSSRDAIVQFTTSESGRYRLLVRDQQHSDRREHGHRYAIELRKPLADIAAIAYLSYPTRNATQATSLAPTIAKQGTLAIAVAVTRFDGWTGPVELHVDGLPPGVSSQGLTLAENQSNGHLIVAAAADATASVSSFSVRASAAVQEKVVERTAIPIELTWGANNTQNVPSARISTSLVLAIEDRDLIPLSVHLGSAETSRVQRGSTFKIPVSLVRSEGGTQDVIVRLRNIPPKTKANELTIKADQTAGEMELTVPQDASLGVYTCWAQCETKLKVRRNPQELERAQNRLTELESMNQTTSWQNLTGWQHLKELTCEIERQKERIKGLEVSTKMFEYTVQMPSTVMRIRIVEKP